MLAIISHIGFVDDHHRRSDTILLVELRTGHIQFRKNGVRNRFLLVTFCRNFGSPVLTDRAKQLLATVVYLTFQYDRR